MDALYIILSLLGIAGGIIALVKGADFFVRSASSLAIKLKISALVIGLTIVAVGTSLPEMAVSIVSAITAANSGKTADISLGNVIGSNIVNITFILGISALICPFAVSKNVIKRDIPFLIVVSFLLVGFIFFFQESRITWWEGIILFILFILYTIFTIKASKKEQLNESLRENNKEKEAEMLSNKKILLYLLIGIVAIILGAEIMTRGATYLGMEIAKAAGLSESASTTLIGLTVVAVGTSLPELVTSAVAAKKGESEIAIGNVVGSNICNILLILGLSSIISSPFSNQEILIDSIIMSAIVVVVFIITLSKKISKFSGGLLIAIYVGYLVYIIARTFYMG